MEVKNSIGGWHKGEYEGKQGVVIAVFDTHTEQFGSTANVRFFEPLDPAQPAIQVPVENLGPVHPQNANEKVLILHGPQKGQPAKVNIVDPGGLAIVTTELYVVEELSLDKLVLLRPDS